jgi:hypothetical protein
MRESRTYGSVRGARGNSRPYRERRFLLWCMSPLVHEAVKKPRPLFGRDGTESGRHVLTLRFSHFGRVEV